MFFDFSLKKIFQAAVAAGVLVATIAFSFVYLVSPALHTMRQLSDAVGKEKSELYYFLRFKFPHEALAAVIGSSTVDVQAQTAGAPSSADAKSVPVLLYHGEGGAATTMTEAIFVDHLRALKNAGWHTITLEQFEAFMDGTGTVPDKSFLLTFDDGRTDTLYMADPVMKDLGFNAVMFVIGGASLPDNSNLPVNGFYLSKAQLASMIASGRWELESHGNLDHRSYGVPTATSSAASADFISNQHFLSSRFWLPDEERIETTDEFTTRVKNDLTATNQLLKDDFGSNVTAFAYPFNDFGQESKNIQNATQLLDQIIPSIYRYAFYQTWEGNGDSFNYPNPGIYNIKRIEPPATWSGADLVAILDEGVPKSLPYTATNFGPWWNTNWGAVEPDASGLRLSATDATTGAAVFLDGTESWVNYKMSASVHWDYGTFSLIARHAEEEDPYVVCAFANDRMYIERHTGEGLTTLASKKYLPPSLPTDAEFSMSVDGDHVSCGAYNTTLTASVAGMLPHGGIGATVWTPSNGAASAKLTAFTVVPL